MNGLINEIVLDSCVCMNFLNGKISALPQGRQFISVITRMEILADPKHTEKTLREVKEFLQNIFVVPLTSEIEEIAIEIRRSGSPRPKLPDAIVAATAILMNTPLVSVDDKLLKLSWPGLRVNNIS